MLIVGQCLIVAGLAGLGYEAFLWGWSGSWLPTTVDDLYRSLGVFDLVQGSDEIRAAASWYLDTPIAALVASYGVALSLLAWWRRRRAAGAEAARPSV